LTKEEIKIILITGGDPTELDNKGALNTGFN